MQAPRGRAAAMTTPSVSETPHRRRAARAQGDARREGRGHDQHSGAPPEGLAALLERTGGSEALLLHLDPNCVIRSAVAFYTFERKVHTERRSGRAGPISRTSCTRRSMSMPTRSAIAW